MSKKIANVLNAAADYVAEAGWCRNAYFDPRGRACLAGAIGIASGHLRPRTEKDRAKLLAAFGLAPKVIADALNGKGDWADQELWKWSNNKASKEAFEKALGVLATTIDTDKITQELADFDEETQRVLVQRFPGHPDAAESYLRQREIARRGLSLDLVTSHNDQVDHTKRGEKTVKVGATTKTSAVKLLRSAAASAS